MASAESGMGLLVPSSGPLRAAVLAWLLLARGSQESSGQFCYIGDNKRNSWVVLLAELLWWFSHNMRLLTPVPTRLVRMSLVSVSRLLRPDRNSLRLFLGQVLQI